MSKVRYMNALFMISLGTTIYDCDFAVWLEKLREVEKYTYILYPVGSIFYEISRTEGIYIPGSGYLYSTLFILC